MCSSLGRLTNPVDARFPQRNERERKRSERTEGQHKVARGIVRCGFKNADGQTDQAEGMERGKVEAWKRACGVF